MSPEKTTLVGLGPGSHSWFVSNFRKASAEAIQIEIKIDSYTAKWVATLFFTSWYDCDLEVGGGKRNLTTNLGFLAAALGFSQFLQHTKVDTLAGTHGELTNPVTQWVTGKR